ncbi:MAG: PKD domain-containing protein, partial [Bacteroidota bacterium]
MYIYYASLRKQERSNFSLMTTMFTAVFVLFALWSCDNATNNQPEVVFSEANGALTAEGQAYQMKFNDETIAVDLFGQGQEIAMNFSDADLSERALNKRDGAVTITDAYYKTDLRFYDNKEGNINYDVILHPGANVEDVKIDLSEYKAAYINHDGELAIPVVNGELRHSKPYVYQDIESEHRVVNSKFTLEDGQLGFDVGDYDENHTLIIDPTIYGVEEESFTNCTGNVLANPGFEDGSSPWYGVDAFIVTHPVNSGAKALLLDIAGGSAGQDITATVAAGDLVNASVYVDNPGTAGWAGFGIDFVDANGTEISEIQAKATQTADYQLFSTSGVAPANTASIRIWFSRSSSTNFDVHFDDACVTVESATAPNTCVSDNQGLTYERFTGISGDNIDHLRNDSSFPDSPTFTGTLTTSDAPDALGDNYGSRIRGFIYTHTTGYYRFNVTSDDDSEVWLSTDDQPSNASIIASVDGFTNITEHHKYSSQTSDEYYLVANVPYYLEILHKEGSGGDHLQLYWKTPWNNTNWTFPHTSKFRQWACGSEYELGNFCDGTTLSSTTTLFSSGNPKTETINQSIPDGNYNLRVKTSDAYSGRQNVTQQNEQVRIQFFDGTNLVAQSGYTIDLPDQVMNGEIITDLGDFTLTNVDKVVIEHFGVANATDGSPNSVKGVEICLSGFDPCEGKTLAFDDPSPVTVTGAAQTINFDNIDISNLAFLTLTTQLSSGNNLDGTNHNDWVDIYYTIDNGTEIKISNQNRDYGDCGPDPDDNDINTNNYDQNRTLSGVSNCTTDWENFTFSEDLIGQGSLLDIRVELFTTSGGHEFITLDDLKVCGVVSTNELCPQGTEGEDVFTMNFDTDDAGNTLVAGTDNINTDQPYDNLFGGGMGITYTTNALATNPLNLYNSNGSGGADPDLERGSSWAAGNIDVDLANLLIINQTTNIGTPNDNGGGGTITMTSDMPLSEIGFDFVDLQEGELDAATNFVRFTDNTTGQSATVPFMDFESGSGSTFDRGAIFGDRTANRVATISAADLGLQFFDQVDLVTTGTYGIGTICVKKEFVCELMVDLGNDQAICEDETITLTPTVTGESAVAGDCVFQESGGTVTMEAENYAEIQDQGDTNNWQVFSNDGDAVGGSFVATANSGASNTTFHNGSKLIYDVNIATAGSYTIYVRRKTDNANGASNSAYGGFDGSPTGVFDNQGNDDSNWVWKSLGASSLAAGDHTVEIVRREDGYKIDRVVVTTGGIPTGNGPAESNCDLVAGTLSYAWSTGETTETIDVSPNSTTSYSLTVTDGAGCEDADTVQVTVKPNPDATVNNQTICSGETVTFTAPNNPNGTTYAWDFGANASPATATGPGPHNVTYSIPIAQNSNSSATVTLTATLNGCEDTDSGQITIQQVPDATAVGTDPTCEQMDGSITFTFSDRSNRTTINFSIDGGATYPFSSDDNAGTFTINNLSAGIYDVFVRWGDGDCPTELDDITLTDLGNPTVMASGEATICTGGTTTLTATGSGGTGTLTYTWMPGNLTGTSVDVSPTTTTTYTVTVEDDKGCTATDQVTVTVVPDPEVTIVASGDEVCVGGSVVLTATVTGGSDCREIIWQFRTGTSGTFNQVGTGDSFVTDNTLQAGTYQYRARYICDATGCNNDNSNVVTLTVFPDPQVTIAIDADEVCDGEQSTLTATVSGGINSSNTCEEVVFEASDIVSYAIDQTQDNGTASPQDNGATLLVQNNAWKAIPFNYQVTANTRLELKFSSNIEGEIHAIGFDDDLVHSPGNLFKLHGSQVTNDFITDFDTYNGSGNDQMFSIPVGQFYTGQQQYLVLITDNDAAPFTGNSFFKDVVVYEDTNGNGMNDECNTSSPNACGDVQWQRRTGTNGSFTDVATGNTYTTDANLAPGTYQYKAIYSCSGSGCGADESNIITFTVKPEPVASVPSSTICSGETVTFNAPSGNPNGTTYTWDFGANASPATATGAGPITVTYTLPANQLFDEVSTVSLTATLNGCTDTATGTVRVEGVPRGTITTTDATCGSNNGKITITFPDYQDRTGIEFSIDGGSTYAPQVGDDDGMYMFSNLAPGDYEVFARWGNDECPVDLGDATINQQNGPMLSTSKVDVACNGDNTGSINLTVTGGTAPFTFAWSNGATTEDLNNIGAGTYSVTVTDDNDCTASTSVTITEPSAIQLTATKMDVSCNGDADGSIDLTVDGGTEPYTFAWSNSANTVDISNLVAGSYTVTVTDANGCIETLSRTITQPDALTATAVVTDVLCNGDANGSIDVTVAGGTSPYTYAWDNGATTQDLNNVTAGTYRLTVTDDNDCDVVLQRTINEPEELTASTGPDQEVCTGETVDIPANAQGGTMPYTYAWNTGSTASELIGVGAGTYTVTVTDDNNCTATSTTVVTENANPTFVITGPDEICEDEQVTFTVSPIITGATYNWTLTGANPSTATGSSVTVTYPDDGNFNIQVQATTSANCSGTANTSITVRPAVVADAGSDEDLCVDGTTTLDGSNSSGTQYLWTVVSGDQSSIDTDPTQVTIDVSPDETTTYRLTVTDAFDVCDDTDDVTVTIDEDENPTASAMVAQNQDEFCTGETVTLDASDSAAPVNAPGTALSYTWFDGNPDNGGTQIGTGVTLDVNPTVTTTYFLVVRAIGSNATCEDVTSVQVNVVKCADLNLTKVVNNSTPNIGDNVVFTIQACNEGPDNATGVAVTDQLPSGYTFVSASPSGDYNSNSGIWTIGNIAANGCETLTITAQVQATGDYVNIASITSANEKDVDSTPGNDPDTDMDGNIGSQDDGDADDVEDPDDEDDADDAEVTPRRVDVSLIKTVNNSTPNVGDNVTFTIRICNDGADRANGIEVTDQLPSGYTFVSTNRPGSYNSSTGVWNAGALNAGACRNLTITAEVLATGDYVNIASVTAMDEIDSDSTPGNDPDTDMDGNIGSQDDGDPNDIEDPDDEDDADDATVTPKRIDLNLTKVVDNKTPNVGENVVFTIQVCNEGPDNATGVQVTDMLPSGYNFVSSAGGSYNDNSGIWNVGGLNANSCKTLTITAEVLATGDYVNIASVTDADQSDIDSTPGNDPDTDMDGNIGSADDGDPDDMEDPDDEDDA